MKTLYDQLQEKHEKLQDLWEKIPKVNEVEEKEEEKRRRKEKEEPVKQTKELIQNIAEAGKFIGNARQRENLRGLLRYWSALIYEKDTTYVPPQMKPFPGKYNDRSRTMLMISVGTLFHVAVITAAVLTFSNLPILHASETPTQAITVSQPNLLPPVICPDYFWPDTEPAVVRWQSQTNDRQAVVQIKQLGNQFASANVLELQIDLDGKDEHRDAGEAFINLRYFSPTGFSPAGLQAPINLEAVPITMTVYVPSLAAGTAEQPNGVQIFVKSQISPDDSFKSEYGTWVDLTNHTDRWLPLSLTPARTAPPKGEMEQGFDPSKIVLIGINIATQKGADVNYSGPIWISDVCWQIQ